MHRFLLAATCGLVLGLPQVPGGEKVKQPLIILDNSGKEVKLTTSSFLIGTRRLPWLDKQPAKEGAEPLGVECLAFREEKSTLYQEGIITLIPLASIRKLDYDLEKKLVTVTVVNAEGKDEVLVGSTKYKGINKLELQAEADLGTLGSAVVKYRGGDATGIRGIRFPDPQPLAGSTGAATKLIADDKEKSVHEAIGLTGLYSAAGKSVLTPAMMFKKTVKVDLAKVSSLKHIAPENPKETSNDFEVTLDDGQKHVLTLLTNTNPQDGNPAQFVGLVGRVPAGYKLFPPYTIAELHAPVEKK